MKRVEIRARQVCRVDPGCAVEGNTVVPEIVDRLAGADGQGDLPGMRQRPEVLEQRMR